MTMLRCAAVLRLLLLGSPQSHTADDPRSLFRSQLHQPFDLRSFVFVNAQQSRHILAESIVSIISFVLILHSGLACNSFNPGAAKRGWFFEQVGKAVCSKLEKKVE